MTAQSGPWLVRSGGRVLGPYSKQQIEQLLRTQEFSVMDEMSQPFKRWYCIKDVPTFAKVIEDIRLQNLKHGEDTVTTNIVDGTNTITLTETINDGNWDDRTEDLFKSKKSKTEIVYEDIDDGSSRKAEPTSTPPAHKSFGYQNDLIVAQQARATARLAWLITGTILLGILGFIFYHRFIALPSQNKGTFNETKQLAMDALTVGDYPAALDYFQKAYRLNPQDKDLYVYLGTLQIQVAGQTVEGRRKLQQVLLGGQGVFPKLAMTALGIADLMDGDTKSADEKFKKSLSEDAYFVPAKVNLGASALIKKNYKKAIEWLSSVTEQGTEEGAAYLMLAEADIHLYREERKTSYLEQAQKQLTRLMQGSFDYYQEAALMLSYIDFILGHREQLEQKISLILDVDPQQTEDHRHDLFVYRGRISWKSLSSFCLQMVDGFESSPRVKALHGYCLFRGGQEVEALKAADNGASQGLKDALVHAIYAYILEGTGQETRSSVALGKSIELNDRSRFALPMILQARFYARANKIDLSLRQWQELYQADAKSLVGLTGLATSYFDKKRYSEAQNYLIEGFRLSRDYRPLFRLKKEAEKEGIMPKNTNFQ